MPELRKDPVTGRWVIIASDRAKRPKSFIISKAPKQTGPCPFCPGNEGMTPEEISAIRPAGGAPNSTEWSMRVVPNKYPALRIEGGLDRKGEGMFDKMNGIGAHEVIIESPDHDKSIADLDENQVADIIKAYKYRTHDLERDARFRYVLIFRNHGPSAGASLDHAHSQIIALPIVPKRVQEEIRGAKQYFEYKERCVFCDMMSEELAAGKRVVLENDEFVVISPFAARFPFETWLLPKKHSSDFAQMPDESVGKCASALKDVLSRTKQVLDDPPYNFIVHTAPVHEHHENEYHWHIEIMPRLTHVAGFEWGSGFYINPTPPEEAAEFLRTITS